MKIIHTSDWHLGARLHEEDRCAEHQAFLAWLLERVKAEKPDVLVIAGDVFDVKAPSPAAQQMYYRFLADVARSGACRRVVVTAGNHDSSKLLAAPAAVLGEIGVTVVAVAQGGDDVAKEVVVVTDDAQRPVLTIGTVPFMYAAELSNFGAEGLSDDVARNVKVAKGWERHYGEVVARARALAPDAPLVLTGHCMLEQATVSDLDSERCRTVGGLESCDPKALAAADYVALGHLHRPQAVKGYETKMFYSGSPLAMSFDEADTSKYINVVTLGAKGAVPVVEQVEVPRTVPIVTLEGKPEQVEEELTRLVATDARRYVRIRLKDFEGAAAPYWSKIRARVKGTQTLLLVEEDLRPMKTATAGLKAFEGKELSQLQPREVAEQKLKSSSAHYSAEDVEVYLKMYDEVASNVLGGAQ